uniref:hypothetical protein n=1 Tax=Aliarcobacter sp. TaxID=2321116 RepID=UPI004048AA9A
MNNHPIKNNYFIKKFIYKNGIVVITLYFFLFFLFLSFIFLFIYSTQIDQKDYTILFKYSLYQSFGFAVKELNFSGIYFDFFSFIHQFFSMLIKLIFTSIVVIKFFSKPIVFHFKNKMNLIDNKLLVISLYNNTDFNINSCKFTVYARLPYKDSNGINCLNNIKLHLEKDYFPFMDKHLVTRIRIDLTKKENNTDFSEKKLNKDLLELFNNNNEMNSSQKLRLTIIVEALCPEIDGNIYEIKNYDITINSETSINEYLTKKAPNSIDIDMLDFSKSKGWENFED